MLEFKQLYYKDGRRYKPYQKLTNIPEQLFYIENDELVPLTKDTMDWYSWRGSPKPGIWICERNRHSWIGDYGISDFRIKLEKYRELILTAIGRAFENVDGKYISRNDIVTEILNELEKELPQENQ